MSMEAVKNLQQANTTHKVVGIQGAGWVIIGCFLIVFFEKNFKKFILKIPLPIVNILLAVVVLMTTYSDEFIEQTVLKEQV